MFKKEQLQWPLHFLGAWDKETRSECDIGPGVYANYLSKMKNKSRRWFGNEIYNQRYTSQKINLRNSYKYRKLL